MTELDRLNRELSKAKIELAKQEECARLHPCRLNWDCVKLASDIVDSLQDEIVKLLLIK